MECGEADKSAVLNISENVESRSAVNSLILDYYKKFGRKRDLEQYFSLSTAQSDIKDPASTFWRRMKTQTESSDSGEGKSESSQELCRISIKCSVPQSSSSQDDEPKSKTESESPPIITEDLALEQSRHSDDESVKSEDNRSQKSYDVLLDLSTNKPLSPSSSVTSQRKLEWDSLADVGYGNESDRKNSASSLSTLERLALKQQYSNNDTKHDNDIGPPTAHSTPLEEVDNKSKGKKGVKKSTKFYKKDIDVVEVNVPHASNTSPSQSINVNLTKHISFSVEKGGEVTFENVKNDISVSPEKNPPEREVSQLSTVDKEMQTSLKKVKDKSDTYIKKPESAPLHIQRVPILISVNTLRKRNMRRKMRIVRRKLKTKKNVEKEKVPQEKSVEQLSEAESFEYMPGHIYNQNKMKANQSRSSNTAGNKSSLESSGILTTDSSKDSKHSLTKDLEKGIELLKEALQPCNDDSHLRKKLVRELVQRLLKSKYRDDESSTEFLSGLSFGSKKLGLSGGNHTTTSTSDANNSGDKPKMTRPKKSILRVDKFNANAIASTSQSAPNLPSATNSEKPVTSNLIRTLTSSNTESDISSKEKTSSDNAFTKTSSEELYKKYLEALRREESYKKHLRDKEMFLKQKLVSSDSVYKATARQNLKSNNRLKDLIKDLTRNNYDDGSGDASKLEGGSNSNLDIEHSNAIGNQRSHSVFTLSSGQSDCQNKKPNLKKRLQNDIHDLARAGTSKDEAHLYCSCSRHSPKPKVGVNDSSVQVNIKYDGSSIESQKGHAEFVKSSDGQKSNRGSPRNLTQFVCENVTGDIKYVCLCCKQAAPIQENSDYLVYKCSRLTDRGKKEPILNMSTTVGIQCECSSPHINNQSTCKIKGIDEIRRESSSSDIRQENKMTSKSSQTNLALKIICQKSSDKSITTSSSSSDLNKYNNINKKQESFETNINNKKITCEATRCIQTEISINPKISDPSLTDINIINDRDCVKLIDEQSKIYSNSDDVVLSSITSEKVDTKRVSDIEQTFSNIETQIRNMQHVENLEENFAIPIQGTNMTVMVRIGTKNPRTVLQTKNDVVITQSVGIDSPLFVDQATSLLEECSKGVQSQNTDIFSNFNINNQIPDSGNIIEQSNTTELVPPIKYPCAMKPSLANESKHKHNTFPKNIPLTERKPFIRSNTDTGNLINYSGFQKNNINKQENDTINDSAISESQIPKSTVNDEMNKKSVCDCGSVNCNCRDKKCYSEPLVVHPNTDKGNLENCCSIQTDENKTEENTQTHSDLGVTQPASTKKNTPKDVKSKILCNCGSLSCSCEEQKCYSNNEEKIILDEECDTKKKDIGTQKNLSEDSLNKEFICTEQLKKHECGCPQHSECKGLCDKQCNSDHTEVEAQSLSKIEQKSSRGKVLLDSQIEKNERKLSKESRKDSENSSSKDTILEMIKDITQRYSKRDIAKNEKKKCFKEIITVMNYLLNTEDSTDNDSHVKSSSPTDAYSCCNKTPEKTILQCDLSNKKKLVDKGIQMYSTKCRTNAKTESSDLPISTDIPSTSSDSATCRVLNRIRKECDRFHQKRCKSSHTGGKKCDASSSTSVNCEKCKRVHHCSCKGHKCKGHKSKSSEKVQKKCVAYNLIIQTSDSVVGEETTMTKDKNLRPLENIIIKVPSKRKVENVPFKEMSAKIETGFGYRGSRSRSLPNETEISNTDIFSKKAHGFTVRDYLEKNRPDFVEKSSNRQDCLKFISQTRANERAAQRNVLSLHLDRRPELIPTSDELRHLAREIGVEIRRKRDAPKFISEREMKKHSQKIYKSLPEVVQKKEEVKKENIKKTNLLMASIFKKITSKYAVAKDVMSLRFR